MPSSLHQKLYLSYLPDGVKLTITSIEPTRPDDKDWYASFTSFNNGGWHSKSLCNGKIYNYITFPFEVSNSIKDGLIGDIKFDGYGGLYSVGTGAKIDIGYRLEGSTTVDGKSIDIDQTGYICASTSDWKGLERPDVSNVTYSIGGVAPSCLSITVPATIAGMPDDALFIFGVNAKEKKIGVNTSTHKDAIDEVLDYVIKGIFFVNARLAGWALFEIL